MVFHYCRVSSKEQNLDRQLAALARYKEADRVFSDKQSGKDFNRESYQEMKSVVVSGDEVIIKELDRLGRNKAEIKEELKFFGDLGVTVRILDIPTTLIDIPGQEWVREMVNNVLIEVMGSIAEQERIKIGGRQREGIDAMPVVDGKRVSKKTGRTYGRPSAEVSDFEKFLKKQKDGLLTVQECCDQMGISRATWYNRLRTER